MAKQKISKSGKSAVAPFKASAARKSGSGSTNTGPGKLQKGKRGV